MRRSMIVKLLLKMWCILVLCPVLLAAGAQTLSIDSQLGTSIEDCFERIAIGEQLPASAIYRNVSELTTRECEQICKQDKQCQAYDYGVGAKGNATCDLSNVGEKDLKEKGTLSRHPDYDVYVRRFQCEQGPPTPLQPQLDEIEGQSHRPVHRPDVEDSKRPLADEFPPDLRPFETTRPDFNPHRPYKPHYLNHVDRPDDYNNQGPDFDRPPSYGAHKPQDIPYRPERPYQNQSQQFDPYDVLHFQNGRPHPTWRPDPNYPPRPADDIPDIYSQKPSRPHHPLPPYRPEEPEYVYINRPNRKPLRPQDEPAPGYGNGPSKPDYPTRPNYLNDDNRPYKPNRPAEYPSRPYDRPSYDYSSQYASSYGQNQYNDNSIYVEIYDPPRPYKPSKPVNDRPVYGSSQGYGQNYGYGSQSNSGYGGSYSSQNSHSQNSQSHYYGTITQLDNYNRPHDQGNRPYKPQDTPSSGYGLQDSQRPTKPYGNPSSGYGLAQDPGYKPQKPAYDVGSSGYGSSQSSNYEQSSGYGQIQKPDYQKPYNEKPSYDSKPPYNQGQYSSQDYSSSQGSYGTSQSSYGSSNRPSSQNYHTNPQSSYGESFGSYDESYGNRPFNDKPLYKPPYNDAPYGNRPSNDRPSYNRPLNDGLPSYNIPIDNKPAYDKPSYGNRPSYGERPEDTPVYGDPPAFDNKPYGVKPLDRPERPYNKPLYDSSLYGNTPVNDDPSYNRPYTERPLNDRPSYGSTPSYNKPVYDEPSYDNNRPDGELGVEDTGGYKNAKPKPKPNQTDGYNRPDIKPVYEYEVERPSGAPSYIVRPGGEVITSRPVSIGDYDNKPAYGREPVLSYKACFRRVLAGKRALRSFVSRVMACERLEDCRRECAEERRFHCESFNYRLDPSFRGKGLCEMMTLPIEAFDLRRDFVEDKEYDFYELDRNSLEPHCPETLRGPGLLHSGYLSSKPQESYQAGAGASWDRMDRNKQGYNGNYNMFYDDRRPNRNQGGGRRGYEDQLFVPYQIGLARTNDDENWGQYGGSYGNSYYKDRNDYHKSINHWGLNDLQPPAYGVRPHGNQNFNYYDLSKKVDRYGYGSWKRGRWNSSGASANGLAYGESSYFKPPKPVYYESAERDLSSEERSGEVIAKDCSSRRRPGMSLGTGAIRRSLLARTVVQCESACFNEREFKCVSYSYRYSNSHGSDNCFLSDRPYVGLELSTDSGSDVYAMPEHHGCAGISTKPFIESECFWHVRSGAAVSGTSVRAALTVAGLGACEAECIRAHAFFCRGFSFRYDSPTIGDDLENCILTSTPPTSLETGRGLRSNAGHELYARGNYGRGCEPALHDDVHQGETGECYLQYDSAAKLIGSAVKGHARVRDERACGQACTDAPFRCLSFSYNNNAPPDSDNCLLSEIRLFDLQRGVDYEHSTDDWLFAFDLFNGQCWRKVHGKSDYDNPVPELPRPLSPPPETYSASAPSGPSGPPESAPSGPTGYLPAPPEVPTYLPGSAPSGPVYKPYAEPRPSYPGPPGYLPRPGPGYQEPEPYRPSGPSGPRPSGPGYLPTGGASAPGYGPSGPYRPGLPSGPPSGPFRPSGPPLRPERPLYPDTGYGPPHLPGPPGPPGPMRPIGPPGPPGPPGIGRPGHREEEPIAVSWRHYTVSGFPCRKGTSCAQNQVAGHWACEPEGGEIGSWDYCCAPTHRCGYSEGFNKPWCYVGTTKDQWRPCSEKYYPYHQHNIPHPSQGNRGEARPPPGRLPGAYDRPDLSYLPEADRRYWDELYNNGPQAYYDKYGNPLPGYTRVPTEARPQIKYRHNYPRPASGHWVPVSSLSGELDPPVPGGLGVPRYWPVAYLHKGPPPNTTYFKYNHTEPTDRYDGPNDRYDRPSDKYDRPNDRNDQPYKFDQPNDRYNPNNRDRPNNRPTDRYDRPTDKYRPNDKYDGPNNKYDGDNDKYDRPNDKYDGPNDKYDRLNDKYDGPNNKYDRPNDKYDGSNNKYDRPNDKYDGPNNKYDRPNDKYDGPNDKYDGPNDKYDTYNDRYDRPDKYNRPTDKYDRPTNKYNGPGDRYDQPTPSRDTPRDPTPRDSTPRDRTPPRERPLTKVNHDKPNNNIDNKNHRDEKTRNITNANDDIFSIDLDKVTTTTPKVEVKEVTEAKVNTTEAPEVETVITESDKNADKELDSIKGIDDKIDDFSSSIEVLDIEDAKKGEKLADLKTLEAEERQIEAIGRLLAARRGGTLVLEKRSQKDLETKSIALDKDLVDFNFGNRFATSERRGTVQRVTKDEIAKERNIDRSLEVSETTFVRPPRVLSTTDNIRKAIVNGKTFYHASAREQRDLLTNSTRRPKSLRPLEERAPSVLANNNFGKKKVIRARNVNPVRKVRRVYRRKYNPGEVRRRLLERERSMKENGENKKV